MTLFADIVGQERAVSLLRQSLASGGAHAYLLAGPPGVGKSSAALDLAAGIVCPDDGCGDCPDCRRVRQGIHPDVEVVSPEGSALLIDQIREINRDVALRPFEARAKAVILLEAETMNLPAANAFLKTLEEPPPHAHFILVTSSPDSLPETIVSRCQRIPFVRTPVPAAIAALRTEYGLSEVDATTFARVTQGDLARARELAASPVARERRALVLGWARQLPDSMPIDLRALLDEMLRSVERWGESRVSTLQAQHELDLEWAADARSRARLEKAHDLRLKREKRRAATDAYREILQTFAGWYRDLACVALGADQAVLNHDYLYELQQAAFPGLLPTYTDLLAALRKAEDRFRYNVDARLALTDLILTMKEILA